MLISVARFAIIITYLTGKFRYVFRVIHIECFRNYYIIHYVYLLCPNMTHDLTVASAIELLNAFSVGLQVNQPIVFDSIYTVSEENLKAISVCDLCLCQTWSDFSHFRPHRPYYRYVRR